MIWIDWLVIFVYLGSVTGLGLWVGRKESGMEDYFLAGRNIPWWAALLSMVATEISAATFLGAPEQGYTRDLTYLQFGIGSILARVVLAFLFIEVYYQLRVYTVYGFLASRFGTPSKSCASATFLLGRLFAGGSRLFIASLAVKVVTGFDMRVSILILGGIALLYTLVGGIRAVIWTDVAQAIVLNLGVVICILTLWHATHMSSGEIWDYLSSHEKLRFFDTDGTTSVKIFSNAYHFIPAILGGFFLTMATHGTDQSMIQRLLTCRTSASSRLSMVASGFLGIGVTVLFMIVGLLLFVIVSKGSADPALLQTAAELKASGRNGDFFLHYIVEALPPGISGLLIAAVLAAAMSSIDSELNSMSGAMVNDFYKPIFHPDASESHYLKWARGFTFLCGFLLMAVAIAIADYYENNPQTDLLSIALGVMTLFYGGLLGIFLVGLLTKRRGSNLTNIIALFASTLLIVFITYKQKILPALGLFSPDQDGPGFFSWLYNFQLAWPWFIILGTAVTFTLSALGMTTHKIVSDHRQAMNYKD